MSIVMCRLWVFRLIGGLDMRFCWEFEEKYILRKECE